MDYTIRLKLKEILDERHISQSQLANMTGIRQGTISDIVRGNRDGVNFEHLSKICKALEIKDLREILNFNGGNK